MHPVRYEAPTTVRDAVRLLQTEPGASLLAGGTDLLVQVRAGVKAPTVFVDLKRIADLMRIVVDDVEGLRLGAAAPAADLVAHPDAKRWWPGLAEAAALIGSTQIQNRGSIGGNLCNASPAADTPASLIVSGATCVITGASGERVVPVEQFLTGPGRTALAGGEFLREIRMPRPAPRTSDAYLRLTPRSEMDIAVVGAAVSVTLDPAGVCTAARVALSAVAPTPILVPVAAAALVGSRVDDETLERVAAAARAAARPIDDKRGTVAYRRQVAGVLARRAAALAWQRARGN